MTNPEIKVRRTKKSRTNSTEKQMLVESVSDSCYDVFDGKVIVSSLRRELDLPEEDAVRLAKKVEESLVKSGFKSVTSSYIRSLVNQLLTELGYDKWLKYSSLSIPRYDVQQLIEEHNQENSNTSFSPESINLTLAGQILKQYALREVFNPKVAEAHLKGDIHLHDLDFINRSYAFAGESSRVMVKYNPTGSCVEMTIKDCFYLLTSSETVQDTQGTILKNFKDYSIKDVNGWTNLVKIVEIPENKDIYKVVLEDGDYLTVTEEHPCLVYESNENYREVKVSDLKIGDYFYSDKWGWLNKIVKIDKIGQEKKVYDITTESSTLICNGIHVHNCSGNSVEYVKKNGLKLHGLMTSSSPAKHASTLVNHLSCFANYLQCYYAGAIGFDAVNMFFAPYLVGMSGKELKQIAQHLIYSFAQLAGARGGQTAFVDFNMYLRVPNHFRTTKAVGADGQYTGKTYSEYESEMRDFFSAILDVLMEGDANKANFAFPKILLHLTENDKNDPLMLKVAEVNSKRGSVYILYDRGKSVKVAQCCRLQLEMLKEDIERMTETPEEMRFSAWQNISINLPRIAYKCKTTLQMHKEIDRIMSIIMQGHKDKYEYICKLLDMGTKGCLNFLTCGMDGKPYLRREEAKFLVGILGLNEMVQAFMGKQLHESDEALQCGLDIMAYLYKSMQRHAENAGLTCILEETPAEGFSLRAALLDLKYCPEAKKYIKGDLSTGHVYYTNSVHLAYNAHVDIFTRIEKQSKFAPLIQAGAIIHNWYGEHEPDPSALVNLYFKVLEHTKAVQTADSPDMTVCKACHTMHKGLLDSCPSCQSKEVFQQTRITGYFSNISGWTKSKLAELKDRVRVDFNMPVDAVEKKEIEYLFFSKPNCDKCEVIKKQLYAHEKVDKIKIVDTATYDGLALACLYNVDALPSIFKVRGHRVISKLEQTGSFLKWIKDNVTE